MKCPKCQYLSFDNAERCRNCGFEFSLAVPDADLPLRTEPPVEGPSRDLTFRREPVSQPPAPGSAARVARTPAAGGFELPLFSEPVPGVDDTPLIKVPATPRAPLAVRRAAGDTPRRVPHAPEATRRPSPAAEPDQELDFGVDLATRHRAPPLVAHEERAVRERSGERAEHAPAARNAAPATRRLVAGLVDLAIMAVIDSLVVYFTLRLTGLGAPQVVRLPLLPLLGFFALLNGGYLVGFTAASGQTIGKMLAGIRVVSESGTSVPLGHAILRGALWIPSVLVFGLGCLPALSASGRALHDRLADTRVVRA